MCNMRCPTRFGEPLACLVEPSLRFAAHNISALADFVVEGVDFGHMIHISGIISLPQVASCVSPL